MCIRTCKHIYIHTTCMYTYLFCHACCGFAKFCQLKLLYAGH